MEEGLRILLAEDSTALAERIAEAIRQVPRVRFLGVVHSEADTLAAVREQRIDVLILDLHLKQGTGFGVLRALAAMPRRPCIVVLTNYDLPAYKSAALALGASHFLDKARDYGRLPEVLHELAQAASAGAAPGAAPGVAS